jgi:hypothetical protein
MDLVEKLQHVNTTAANVRALLDRQFDQFPGCSQCKRMALLCPITTLALCFPRDLVAGLPKLFLGWQWGDDKAYFVKMAHGGWLEVEQQIHNSIYHT